MKNEVKQHKYSEMMTKLKRATYEEYYYEAIFIEYAILEDRTESILKHANVKYKDKFYTFAMNGQTGEFVGNIPVDKKKALKYGILTFVITFALVLLISYLFYIGGHK